ncbi:hypothetical protein GGI07_002068 [Coemansia sp. Benny D115]|nr:hypothetical protein GGI07_002068 [Coemansia sp. Benny D115]
MSMSGNSSKYRQQTKALADVYEEETLADNCYDDGYRYNDKHLQQSTGFGAANVYNDGYRQNGFEGYLSDESDSVPSKFNHPEANRANVDVTSAQVTSGAQPTQTRRYLHHRITATPVQPESSLPKLDRSFTTKSNSRPSWSALGRRLSLSTGPNRFSRSHSSAAVSDRRVRNSFGFYRSNGATELTTPELKPTTSSGPSWFGTLKMKLKGNRKTAPVLDPVDTVPITIVNLHEDENDEQFQGLANDDTGSPTRNSSSKALGYPYPRLRSQPSLCRSNRTSSNNNNDDVVFVPDIENMNGKSAQPTTPSHPYRTSKKSLFLLPSRSNITQESGLSALKD